MSPFVPFCPLLSSAEQLRQLVNDLDSRRFKQRSAASQEPARLEEEVEPTLTAALKGDLSAEARQRIEALLSRPRRVQRPEKLRALRALEVLEHIGSPQARTVLERLAKGNPAARLTR